MNLRIPRRITLEMAERILADAVMVNVSLIAAFLVRFLLLFLSQGSDSGVAIEFYTSMSRQYIEAYLDTFWILSLICLAIFYFSGFYTYGRAYRSRYKALLIFQAVSIAYLLFGFLSYFCDPSVFPKTLFQATVPRTVLVGSYLLSLTLVGGLRVWSALWRRATWAEAKIWGKPSKRPIRSVTVIGGAGYIGSVLVRMLLDRGYDVSVLDNLLYGDKSISDLIGREGFELIRDDFRKIDAVVRALQHADAVVHLGALVGDPACALDERLTLEINLAATRMIAEAAKGYGVQRFVFASTCSVYGASQEILDEHSALKPVSLYARTKAASETILLNMAGEGFVPIILRFGTAYGLSPRPRFDLVINLLAAKAVLDGSITIFGGDQWRPFIHVHDAAAAVLKCLEVPVDSVQGEVFNAGCDEQNYQIKELGSIIKRLLPEAEIVQNTDDIDPRNYRVSFAKIHTWLGFLPSRSVTDGVLEVKHALERGEIETYRDPTYSNYKSLSDDANHELVHRTHITPLYETLLSEEEASRVPDLAGVGQLRRPSASYQDSAESQVETEQYREIGAAD